MSDAQVKKPGSLVDIVDAEWEKHQLPCEDIAVPSKELPDPEPDSNCLNSETLADQEKKWVDLALQQLSRHTPPTQYTQQ